MQTQNTFLDAAPSVIKNRRVESGPRCESQGGVWIFSPQFHPVFLTNCPRLTGHSSVHEPCYKMDFQQGNKLRAHRCSPNCPVEIGYSDLITEQICKNTEMVYARLAVALFWDLGAKYLLKYTKRRNLGGPTKARHTCLQQQTWTFKLFTPSSLRWPGGRKDKLG